ncbi:ABC transporter substrate-binding protein [Paracoccus sp. DMF-8]|uniref:ABC transporter substrate-binding protein n=1 Tax=Paracoccus sp. DMF-8 TaxID=3019445 RepID=UPI0023E8D331|nr:ABC transporter substrate-binding protein [Paracoccus sp. DMF-8]MDF3605750.1 ABC transporter substrate-binding protein [Paracoccus sp. DMF-8]
MRFTFSEDDRELAMLMGLRPILQKAQWQGKDFSESGLEIPIGSGPYVITRVDAGRRLVLRRNPDYWGRDLPSAQGMHNFDEIRFDWFGDANAMFEAFKAGEIDVWRELVAAKWKRDFDFPAMRDGRVVKAEIPNRRPSGIMGLVMNTRNPLFQDWRVRQAMIEAFNFQFTNATLSGGDDPRITSYFSNSELAMDHGLAPGPRTILALSRVTCCPARSKATACPQAAPRLLDRPGITAALRLLADAAGPCMTTG